MNPVLEDALVGFVSGAIWIVLWIIWRKIGRPAWHKFRSAIGLPYREPQEKPQGGLDDNPF